MMAIVWVAMACLLWPRNSFLETPAPRLRLSHNISSMDPPAQGRRYSTLTCWRSHPGTPVELFTTCHATDVCFDGLRWLFFPPANPSVSVLSPEAADLAGALASVARLGGYENSPLFSMEPAPFDRAALDASACFSPHPTVLTAFTLANPMWFHWVLDDLLGLFWTLQTHNLTAAPDLAILNLSPLPHPWSRMLADYFSPNHPVAALPSGPALSCYSSLYLGPAHHHFGGPGRVQLQRPLLSTFASHFLRALPPPPSPPPTVPARPYLLVVNRRADRLILNFEALLEAVSRALAHRFTVIPFVFEDHPHHLQLQYLRHAAGLVSTHGSQLTNMIWLSALSSPPCVLEIFPYNFSRPTYRDLASLLGIRHRAWHNPHLHHTRFHPEILHDRHLAPPQIEAIIQNPHSVYHSWPANLYWVNQDTIVDSDQIIHQLLGCFDN